VLIPVMAAVAVDLLTILVVAALILVMVVLIPVMAAVAVDLVAVAVIVIVAALITAVTDLVVVGYSVPFRL
jgi:hypothetical protein